MHEETEAIILEELLFFKEQENRRGHSIDLMAIIVVHVGRLLGLR